MWGSAWKKDRKLSSFALENKLELPVTFFNCYKYGKKIPLWEKFVRLRIIEGNWEKEYKKRDLKRSNVKTVLVKQKTIFKRQYAFCHNTALGVIFKVNFQLK